jgi:hypothetical protein
VSRTQAPVAPSAPASAPPTRRAAILTPAIDLLLVGGLSLIVFVPLLLSGRSDLVMIGAGAQAFLGTVINMPHFMASYRLVYRSRETILRHKWASIFVPAILFVYIGVAIWEAQYSPVLVIVLVTVASAYLAWHYTGQVWGMMASFAYLEGVSFDKSERLLVRTGLRILLVWHLSWFLYTELRDPSKVRPLYLIVSAGTLIAFALGVIGLVKLRRRTGKNPPVRTLVAWLALFVWYAMMARDPKAIFWIQLAHALQYLAFPIRVEMNRTSRPSTPRWKFVLHMGLYALALLAISFIVSQVVPGRAMDAVAVVFGEEPGKVVPILILMFVNIHHYFTDGVIWKISNPEVRKDLFAHVRVAKTADVDRASLMAGELPSPVGRRATHAGAGNSSGAPPK